MADVQLLLQLSSVVFVPAIFFLAIYLYYTKNYGYWKKRKVPEVPPSFPMGSLGGGWKEPQGVFEEKWYKKYGKVFGIYEGGTPAIMVADPELLKNILVKDFATFPNLRELRSGNPTFDRMIFAQNGEHWKELRTVMSPSFTSGKMRMMAHLINECAQTTVENFLQNDKKEIDVNRYFGAFTMDVIARCAFGMKLDSRKDPENPFVKHAKSIFSGKWRFFLPLIAPRLSRLMKLSFMDPEATKFFEDVVNHVIESRKHASMGEAPPDFIQLLLNAKEIEENRHKIDNYDIIANCIVFFIAGYITTTATLSMTMHALAYNPECQEKVIKEIEEATRNKKELDFDTVAGMKYLDAVISEVLRLRTPVPRLERTAVEDYVLGDTGITIPKGMVVAVPIYAIHHDPHYFPDPETFKPERFLPENKDLITPYTYLPFGNGPRNCLGMRFAMMEIKLCIAHTLLNVRFSPGPTSTADVKYVTGRELQRPEHMFLKVERRQDK